MEMGLFGHVPSAEEIEAKAFITTQEPWRDQWSWPAYIAGLADAGVGDERVCHLLSAACKGEFTGNVELGGHTYLTENVRHYHQPTVEDVLREFYVLAVRGKEAHAEDVDEGVLAEYAAKLRLAGDAE